MGFLDGLFENKAAKIQASATIARAVQGGGYDTWGGSFASVPTNWDLEKSITKGYERVIWIFRCVDAIASAQATVPILLKDYNVQEGHIVENKNLHKMLNRKTNPYEDAWTFRYRLSGQLLLSPKGSFIEIVKARSGEVQQMYLLNPENVEPIKDAKTWISGYKVTRAGGGVDILDPEDVIWLRVKPHMTDPYRQMTPLTAAGLAAETDYLARMFNRNFLKNDGRPGMLISINGDLSAEDGMEIKNKFDGGYSTAGRTAVIEAEGIDVVDMSARSRDVQWNEAIQGSKDDILLAFGCPESVLGNASGRCLRASELVHLASGEAKPAQELVGQTFELLQPTKDGNIAVKAVAEYALKEKIYKITTFSGRTLETNAQHPLFMGLSRNQGPFKRSLFPIGWTPMGEIKQSYERNNCQSEQVYTEVAVPVYFDQTDAVDVDQKQLLEDAKAFKTLPEYLFTAKIDDQRKFLSIIYSNHGKFSQHTSFDICPPSLEYANRLQRLLLRVGSHSAVATKKLAHQVSVSGKINMFAFLQNLELTGEALAKAQTVRDRLASSTTREHNAFRSDGLPPGLIWDRVLKVEEIGEDQTVALTVGDYKAHSQDHSYLGMFWEHNTYNNAENENEQWWTGTVRTHCDAIARGMETLTGSDDDDLYLEYDYTTVDVLQRAERRKHDKLAQDLARGAITMDDYRVGTGRSPLNIPATRVLIHPTRMVSGNDPADVEAVRNLPILGAPTGGGGIPATNPFTGAPTATGADGVIGGNNDFTQGEQAANETGDPTQTVNDIAARTVRSAGDTGSTPNNANPNAIVDISERIDQLLNKTFDPIEPYTLEFGSAEHYAVKGQLQGAIEGLLTVWSNNQINVAKTRVTHAKVRKGTRHWETEEKALPQTATCKRCSNAATVWVLHAEGMAVIPACDSHKESYKASVGNEFVGFRDMGWHSEKALDTNYIVDTKEWSDELFGPAREIALKTLSKFDKQDRFAVALADVAEKVATEVTQEAELQTELLRTHIGIMDIAGKSIAEIQDTIQPSAFDRPDWIVRLSEKATTRAIVSVEGILSSFVDDVEVKTIKFVRTVSGVRRYGLDKGSIIVRDGMKPLDGLVALTNDLDGYEKVADHSGKIYYVGKENGFYVIRDPLDNSKLYEGGDEQTVFQWLNKKVGGSEIGENAPAQDAFDASPNKKPTDTVERGQLRQELVKPANNYHLTAGQASAADNLNDAQLKEYLKQRQRGLDHIRALSVARAFTAKKIP